MDILTRHAFGVAADPWSALTMRTADVQRTALLVGAALNYQSMIWVLGPRGVGKSHAVRAALGGADVPLIEPLRLDREKLTLADIQTAIVRDLSSETPRHSGEARSAQVRRLLGTAPRRPVLVIDEAHALHHMTVRGLKRLRELSWRGRTRLLGVVLVGQRDSAAHVAEVALRSDRMVLAGLTGEEAAEALVRALNADTVRIRPGAAQALAQSERARNWLDLQALADECMATAVASGERHITSAIAEAVVRPGARRAEPMPAPSAPSDDAVGDFLSKRAAA